jgi:hypothetical protein
MSELTPREAADEVEQLARMALGSGLTGRALRVLIDHARATSPADEDDTPLTDIADQVEDVVMTWDVFDPEYDNLAELRGAVFRLRRLARNAGEDALPLLCDECEHGHCDPNADESCSRTCCPACTARRTDGTFPSSFFGGAR